MEYFANRLVAEKANKNVNLFPYNKLIGAWNFEMKCFNEHGNIEDESNGEWIFSYILDSFFNISSKSSSVYLLSCKVSFIFLYSLSLII